MNNLILDCISKTHVLTFKRKKKKWRFVILCTSSWCHQLFVAFQSSPWTCCGSRHDFMPRLMAWGRGWGHRHTNRISVPEVLWYLWGDQDFSVNGWRLNLSTPAVWKHKKSRTLYWYSPPSHPTHFYVLIIPFFLANLLFKKKKRN